MGLEGLCEMWQLQQRWEYPFSLECYMDEIERCFTGDSVNAIIHELQSVKEDKENRFNNSSYNWAQRTLEKIRQNCPLSVKVAYEAIKRGSKMSLENCLKMESILAQNFLTCPD